MTYLQTFSGRKFDLLTCTVDDIDIVDIAHALSLINRFGGHTAYPYSVAQHSCIAASEATKRGVDPMSMLLHDAAEAYVGDIPKHIKTYLGSRFADLEDTVAKLIANKYGTTWPMTGAMVSIDHDLLETEFRDVVQKSFEGRTIYGTPFDEMIHPMTYHTAKQLFLSMFRCSGL